MQTPKFGLVGEASDPTRRYHVPDEKQGCMEVLDFWDETLC